jgi:hypothetical protein
MSFLDPMAWLQRLAAGWRVRPGTPALMSAVMPAIALALGAALAACGGGTSQYDPFVPGRLIAFGDEMSVLTAEPAGPTDPPRGSKYAINGINANNTAEDTTDDFFDCRLLPNWTQALASDYGFVFAECKGDSQVEPQAHNRAAPGARVAEVAAQVEAQAVNGGFRSNDLVTLLVGINDVVEVYRRFDGSNEAALLAEVRERGNRAGQIVNRLVALGAKVVVSNLPDIGYSPLAKSENEANPGSDRAGMLSRLTQAFNERLGVTMLIDGRFVALAQTDQRILAAVRSPASFAISNVGDAACAKPPPACTSGTLVAGATTATHLWADGPWLAARGHSEIAALAIARARRNPF